MVSKRAFVETGGVNLVPQQRLIPAVPRSSSSRITVASDCSLDTLFISSVRVWATKTRLATPASARPPRRDHAQSLHDAAVAWSCLAATAAVASVGVLTRPRCFCERCQSPLDRKSQRRFSPLRRCIILHIHARRPPPPSLDHIS